MMSTRHSQGVNSDAVTPKKPTIAHSTERTMPIRCQPFNAFRADAPVCRTDNLHFFASSEMPGSCVPRTATLREGPSIDRQRWLAARAACAGGNRRRMADPPHRSARYCGGRPKRAGTATPGCRYICNSRISPKLRTIRYTKACAMWRMSSAQALIFIAVVVIAVALLMWIGL
jgi:hypothetical protein